MIFNAPLQELVDQYGKFQRDHDVVWQTVNNGMSLASARFTVAGNTTRYLGLVPASGKRCFLYGRNLVISASIFNVDVVTLATYTLGTDQATISPLRQGATPITSLVYTNVTNPTGESIKEYGYIEVGDTPSSGRAAGVVDVANIVKVFNSPAFLKLQNTTGTSATCTINLLLWEETI